VDLREILNAIRYMARSAGGWRLLPTEFGQWQTVYWWFRRFVRLLLFRTIHNVALIMDRERAGARQAHRLLSSTARRSKHRPRLPAATTPTRRSSGASATSRSTRPAAC
jgi:transposase